MCVYTGRDLGRDRQTDGIKFYDNVQKYLY